MTDIISIADAKAAGLKRYFTGKMCNHGHIAERNVDNRQCVECRNNRCRKYYQENLNKEKERGKNRYHSNKQDRQRRFKEWKEKNFEHQRARSRAWRKENEERARENSRRWSIENKEQNSIKSRNYRARSKMSDGTHTISDITEIRAAQKDKCAYCGVKLKGKGHLDHITPLVRGGSNWPNNLQWLCAPCNLKKNASDPIEFAQRLGKLL